MSDSLDYGNTSDDDFTASRITGGDTKTDFKKAQLGKDFEDVQKLISENYGLHQFVTWMYFGTGKNRTGEFLISYAAERLDNFNDRKLLAPRTGIYREVVDSNWIKVFSEEPERKYFKTGTEEPYEDELLKKYVKSAGIDGQSLTTLVKEDVRYLHINFTCFSIIDTPKEVSKLKKDDIESKPWTYLKTVLDIPKDGYTLDDKKQLKTIEFFDDLIKYPFDEIENTDELKPEDEIETYRHWSETETYRYYYEGEEKKIIGEVVPLDFLPVKMLLYTGREDVNSILQQPPFFESAWDEYILNNKKSTSDSTLRASGYSMLYGPDMGDMIGGPKAYIQVDKDDVTPGYVSPDHEIFRNSRDDIEFEQKEIRTKHNIRDATGIKTASSGDALKFEFLEGDEKNRNASKLAEYVDREKIEQFKQKTGQEFDYYVKYRDKFSPDNIQELISSIGNVFQDTKPGEKGQLMLMEKIYRAMNPKATDTELKELKESDLERLNREKTEIDTSPGANFEDSGEEDN